MSDLCSSADLEKRVYELPEAALERVYLEEFLAERGYSLKTLKGLPRDEARKLMIEACRHAMLKLADMEAKAHLQHEIHGITKPT